MQLTLGLKSQATSMRRSGRAPGGLLMTIDISSKSLTHDFNWSDLAAPDLQGFGALVQKHPQAVRNAASRCSGLLEQQRFGGPVDHVINSRGLPEGKCGRVKGQSVRGLQAERSRVEDQINLSLGVTHCQFDRWPKFLNFQRNRLGFGRRSIDQPEFIDTFSCQFQSRGPSG